MKIFFPCIFYFFILSPLLWRGAGGEVFSQTNKSKIVLKDKTVFSNVKIWNIYSNKIEYEEGESLHDILTERIARIETDTAVLSFDEKGQLNSRPYDWIVKTTGDTMPCIISQLGGNYIYYYPKGKDNRSYVPVTSVKDYRVQEPKPVQKLEQGSAVYSPQVSQQDTMREPKSEAKTESATTSNEQPPTFGTGQAVTGSQQPVTDNEQPVNSPNKVTDSVIKWSDYRYKTDPLFQENKKEEPLISSPLVTTPPPANDQCYESYMFGQRAANMKTESLWGSGSFCLSGCLGAIPVATMSLFAINSTRKPQNIPSDVDEKCYTMGYQNQRSKNRVQSISIGGIMSSVMLVAVLVLVNNIK